MVISDTHHHAYRVVGTRPIRPDGLDKVTGRAQYGADIKLEGLVQAAVLRSPHVHARIKSIDTSRAKKAPGVLAVMTGADMPAAAAGMVEIGEEGNVALTWSSNRVMAHGKVLFKGHPVAAVAAYDRNSALEALKLIDVEYEPLEPVLNIKHALAPGAPLVHDDMIGNHLGESVRDTNIAAIIRHELGDPTRAMDRATLVIDREVELSTVHQGYIEPQSGTAFWDENGRVTIWTSTQGAFGVRSQMAGVLNVSESDVHVIPMEIGGGFGGKLNVYLEPVAAVLSKMCGRPVKAYMDRASVFESTGPAAAAIIKIKMGVDDDGVIIAAEADLKYEAGSYPGSPVAAGAVCCFAAYDIANVRIDGYDVLVTKSKTSAYRAPGSTHVAYGVESVIDEICEQRGYDPIEFRLKNASKQGKRRADGPIWGPIGITQVLEAARDSAHWQSPLEKTGPGGKKRGRGIATGFWRNGGRRSVVTLNLNSDGVVSLIEGSVDIGGSRASIAMQAAEVLHIPIEDIRPTIGSTDTVGYTDNTGGSRTTYATGMASYRAAEMMVDELKTRAAKIWDVQPSEVVYQGGSFQAMQDAELQPMGMTFKELAARIDGTGGPVAVTGSVDIAEAGGAFATHIVDLEVDPETGKTDVLRYTVVQDVGGAIHPSYVEGQMQGGAVQGIGWALNEEYYLTDEGRMANSSFLDYRMPTAFDLPEIETILIEVANPIHPFGVRGAGEVPIAPPVGAIANALYDALGTRFRQAPMKPARILESLGVLTEGVR
ncbi:MAG: xanthine dehydrogenase family protein molybdopterin-binding subunit [Chloroflexi bacterium]|nr:xanthine dehydrogenase family protein molybdopterin-binding subunit [Chloroflexota bacterium]